MLGNSLAGDVESRAVVHRRADEGESQSCGDALIETVDFRGDVALVVLKGEDRVVTALDGLM